MARRLYPYNLILGLVLTTANADLNSACAQSAQQDTPAKVNQDKPSGKSSDKDSASRPADPPGDDKRRDDKHGDDKHGDDKRGDDKRGGHEGERRGEGRGDGRRGPGFNADAMLAVMKRNPGFILEVVKRDGGPLELLAPLMKTEVREHLALQPEQAAAADKFLADMTARFEEDITAHKNEANVDWEELFNARLKVENAKFEEFLTKELPLDKQERLIGIFVQYRNLRALGNRVVATKVGMTAEEASKLHSDIHRVRMETIREKDDWARTRVINGNNVLQSEQLRIVRTMIDKRIEKLVKKEHLEKLQALRGEKLPETLLETLDRPPAPPPRKN